MFDEGVADRWMALEMRSLHAGLVVRKRSLAELLREEAPQTATRDGEVHAFDPAILRRVTEVTTEEERARLRLPVTLRFHLSLEDACSLEDELAAEVFRRLEGFGKAYPFREGRAWLPYSLGLALLLRYPTVVQRLLVP